VWVVGSWRTYKVNGGTLARKTFTNAFGLDISASGNGVSLTDNTTEDLYVVRDFGLVETAGGTTTSTILGHSFNEPSPAEELVSFQVHQPPHLP
jgi:hypothetical protein